MICPVCQFAGSHEIRRMPDRLGLVAGQFRIVQCDEPGCRVQYLDPMPDPNLKDPYFEIYWGSEGKVSTPLSRLAMRYKKLVDASVLRIFKPLLRERARVLDIGCGSGDNLAILHEWGFECWGLDQSPAGVEAVRARLPVEVRLGSIFQNDLEPGSFDLVLMSHVMEHIAEPARAAGEVQKLLKPGGIACIIVPNHESFETKLMGRHWFPYFPPRHVIFFNPSALARLLKGAGLKVYRVAYPWLQGAALSSSIAPFLNYYHSKRRGGIGGAIATLTNASVAAASIPFTVLSGMLGHGPSVMVLAQKP